jgi:hypothetical protein
MDDKQLGHSDYKLTTDKKRINREKALAKIDAVVPRQALIEPHYPKVSNKGPRHPIRSPAYFGSTYCSSGIRSATHR